MVDKAQVPRAFGASSRLGHSDEVKQVLRDLDALVDELFLKEMEPAILRARAALGLDEK